MGFSTHRPLPWITRGARGADPAAAGAGRPQDEHPGVLVPVDPMSPTTKALWKPTGMKMVTLL